MEGIEPSLEVLETSAHPVSRLERPAKAVLLDLTVDLSDVRVQTFFRQHRYACISQLPLGFLLVVQELEQHLPHPHVGLVGPGLEFT